ncbi:MAG: YvrJ family protein [Vulcanibacillus sp.]
MTDIDWLNSVGNVGFPIVITIYLLYRFEKKLDTLTKGINELTKALYQFISK